MATKTITFPFEKKASLTILVSKLISFLEKEKLKINVALTENGFSIKGESKRQSGDWIPNRMII